MRSASSLYYSLDDAYESDCYLSLDENEQREDINLDGPTALQNYGSEQNNKSVCSTVRISVHIWIICSTLGVLGCFALLVRAPAAPKPEPVTVRKRARMVGLQAYRVKRLKA